MRTCGSRTDLAGSTPRCFDSPGEAARELMRVAGSAVALGRAYRGGLSPALSLSTSLGRRSPPSAGVSHPVFARVWARVAGLVGSDAQRRELLDGLRGRVLEVGAGEGRNFAHYPPGVSDVVAIEPERYLRRMASAAGDRSVVRVEVLAGTAEALPVADASCDAAVTSLVLCSVADQQAALAELRRVLVAGGELRFYEHVVAHNALAARGQQWLDRTGIWPRLAAGCHLSRDTVSAITAAGFAVETLRRFPSGPGPFGVPFVLGRARRLPH